MHLSQLITITLATLVTYAMAAPPPNVKSVPARTEISIDYINAGYANNDEAECAKNGRECLKAKPKSTEELDKCMTQKAQAKPLKIK